MKKSALSIVLLAGVLLLGACSSKMEAEIVSDLKDFKEAVDVQFEKFNKSLGIGSAYESKQESDTPHSKPRPGAQQPEPELPEGTTEDGYDINSPYANAGNTPELAMEFIKEYSTILERLYADENLMFNEIYKAEILDFSNRVSEYGADFGLNYLADSSDSLAKYVETGVTFHIADIDYAYDQFESAMPKSEYTDYIKFYIVELDMREEQNFNEYLSDLESEITDNDSTASTGEHSDVVLNYITRYNTLLSKLYNNFDYVYVYTFTEELLTLSAEMSSDEDEYDLYNLIESINYFADFTSEVTSYNISDALYYAEEFSNSRPESDAVNEMLSYLEYFNSYTY